MQLDRLITYFDTSPSIKLFRSSQNAPFILHFLYRVFKESGSITISHSELLASLIEYRDTIAESHGEVLRDKPEQYLSGWCSGETRWLRRYVQTATNEPVYQLTPHTEDVFAFLDRALQRDVGIVGTESRLRIVIDTLTDLVAGATDDPTIRLKHLNEARAKIDDEISRVLVDGIVTQYEPAKVREQFATAVMMLKELLGDFRAVEDRFKDITRQVQRRHLDGKDTRGNILAFALDSEDMLKQDDQGASFYEFLRFILSPVQQDKLQEIIQELSRLEALTAQSDGLTTVRRMIPSLVREAEKVMRTNQRLSATLRRLLDNRSVSERHRLAQLIGEIKAAAGTLSDDPPYQHVTLMVDKHPEIRSPFARTFWTKPNQFVITDLVESPIDEKQRVEAFTHLSQLQRLNWKKMRQRIAEATSRHISVSLRELLQEFPHDGGIIETLGYIQIAKDDGHLVNPDQSEEIIIRNPSFERPGLKLRVPLVQFLPPIEVSNVTHNSKLPA